MAFDESAAFTPPAAFGPYRVLHQIGSGVQGPVFRTYDPQQDRLVAVKAFRHDVIPETVAKLAEELRRLPSSGITNPTIVQVLDAGLEGPSAYLAMEYVSAETLDVALRHLAPSPLDRALPMLVELAQAIEAAWAAGLGHGAIHPRDVFVLSGTNDVRLTGCGVVPALEAAGIKVPARRPYTAPERGAGEGWDIRADIYSLGVLAHELLTKRRPGGANEQDGSLVTGTTPEARVQIRRVLAAAMADRPEARFATPTAFTDALAAIVRGETPAGLPEGANVAAAVVDEPKPTPSSKKVHEPPPLLAMAEAPLEVVEPFVPPPPVSVPVAPVSLEAPEPLVVAAPPASVWSPEPPEPAAVAPINLEAREPVVVPAEVATPPVVPIVTPTRRPPVTPAPEPTAVTSSVAAARDRTPPYGRPVSPPPLRVSPPPVIVPVRMAFPWAAVLAAAVASGTLFGVGGYWMGLSHQQPAPVAAPTTEAANQPSAMAAPPPGTDVVVPAPLVPGGGSAAPVASTPATPTTSAPPVQAPAPEAKEPPAKEPTSAKSAAHPAAKAKPESVLGSLLIESRPTGARVVLDGKSLGVTPLTLPDVHVGSHPLRLERAGYKTLVTSVVVKSGERSRVAVTLELSGVAGPWMPPSR